MIPETVYADLADAYARAIDRTLEDALQTVQGQHHGTGRRCGQCGEWTHWGTCCGEDV